MSRSHALFREEGGFSLVELLVVMLIFGVVGAVTLTGLVSGLRTTTYADQRIQALTDTQNTLANVSRELRAADSRATANAAALRSAGPSQVEFDVLRVDRRIRFVLTVEEGDLRQSRRVWDDATVDPDSIAPDLTGERVLITGLADTMTRPVFSFRDQDRNCLTGCRDANGVLLTAPLDEPGLAAVAEVQMSVLRLVVEDEEPIEVETRVTVRNR